MIPRYRGWDIKRKIMYPPEELAEDGLTLSPDGRGFVNISGKSSKLNEFYKHIIPLQSSGFNDKYNIEIFDGTILHLQKDPLTKPPFVWDNIKKYVYIENGIFMVGGRSLFKASTLFIYKFEVVGSIQTNPEFLK